VAAGGRPAGRRAGGVAGVGAHGWEPIAERAGHAAGRSAGQPGSRYDDAHTAVIRDAVGTVVSALRAATGRDRLDIVDAGGGTGGFAVPLAGEGHAVTVVDPSPDSLAAAERRAAERGVPVRAVQGDAADLATLVGEQSADLVLCHSVLEYVESPLVALNAIAGVLRPGGAVSVVAASAVAAVIHRALAGRFDDARLLLAALPLPQGAGETGSGMRSTQAQTEEARATGGEVGSGRDGRGTATRRFTVAAVAGLLTEAGLRPGRAHGVRVFADIVPGVVADSDPGAAAALAALEEAASAHPAFHDFATAFHLLGYR
jgi:S-adenosylmethionine-dependent methyltransferase